jgi:NADPH:quinone reductase-like Zn-dependent oxidoreductase
LYGLSLWPNAKSGEFYGITALYRKDRGPFMTDLPILFDLLGTGKLKPRISAKFPLLEAAQANELLESGQVSGKIVLLAPELLQETPDAREVKPQATKQEAK